MWQQHFGSPYGESFSFLTHLDREGTPPPRPEGTLPLGMDHRPAEIIPRRTKESDPEALSPVLAHPRDGQEKAMRGMVLAFVGGLLAGLLLAKRE